MYEIFEIYPTAIFCKIPEATITHCEDSDTDLMVVVSEDHSLGRHVSQRSHRTDRSREKPELRARRPGARSPWTAREREREVSGEEGGGGREPVGLRPGEAAPGARESAGGGGVRARDPESGWEAASCGGHTPRLLEEYARRCLSGPESQAALRNARARAAG